MEPTEFKYTYTVVTGGPFVIVSIANNVGYPNHTFRYQLEGTPLEQRNEGLARATQTMANDGYYDSRNNLTYEPEGTPIPEGFLNFPRDIVIRGRVSSSENARPLSRVTVDYGGQRTQTDPNGRFKLEFTFTPGDQIGEVVFTRDNFSEARVFPANQDNTFKATLSNVQLDPIEQNLVKVESQVVADGIEDHVDRLRSLNPADAQQALINRINKAQERLYASFIPAIIALLSQFGMQVAKNALVGSQPQSCPPFRDLRRLIQRRNRLTRQLNRLYRTVRTITRAVTGLRNIIRVISVLFRVLKNLPLPTAIIPPVTGGIGLPMNLVQKIDDTKDKIEQRIGATERIATVVLGVLALLGSAIQQALALLRGLDAATAQCLNEIRETVRQTVEGEITSTSAASIITGSSDIGIGVGANGQNVREGLNTNDLNRDGGSDIDYSTIPNLNEILGTEGLDNDEIVDLLAGNYFQEQLDNDLIELSSILLDEQGADSSPREVNGFILEVQTDPKYEVGQINRRFAVGKNRDGIVLIQGDPSFASSDQILIDELAFFIEQNDLKPN